MNEILELWQAWETRTGNRFESALHLSSDGSGTLDERDLYGPTHRFNSLEELTAILSPENTPDQPR